MEKVFAEATNTPDVPVVEDSDKTKKNEQLQVMKSVFKRTVESDPTFTQRLRRLSSSLKVVNSLGFGEGGNVVVDKTAPVILDENGKAKRKLAPTAKIVGYRVANIGEEAVSYATQVWKKDEATGEFVAEEVTKTLAPGEYADLPRKYMTIMCAQPEISFTLANGIIVASAAKKNCRDLDSELSSYYFKFSPDENGNKLAINDDEVKISIDIEGPEGTRVVAPEFEETFGFLNNKKAKKAGRKTSTGRKASVQDLFANYVNNLISERTV